jgi:predicted CoA-binding protein
VLGEKSYPDLCSIPEAVEVVQVFRQPNAVPRVLAGDHQSISERAATLPWHKGCAFDRY